MSEHPKTDLHAAQPEDAMLPEMPHETNSRRATLRPAPLSLKCTGFDEQPRVGPLPPTPQQPTARKRKNPPTILENKKPNYQRKKQFTIEQHAPATVVANRVKFDDLVITMNDKGVHKVEDVEGTSSTFPFMELPGEIRNVIYSHCIRMSNKQALLIHLPKTSTLRASTRKGRSAIGKYCDPEDPDKKNKGQEGPVNEVPPKGSNRPFVGLTQVCQQIRNEFYPLYIAKQEIGMDLTDTSKYMKTFFNWKVLISYADAYDPTGKNMPFRGNITIAVAEKILPIEKAIGWIDVLPLLTTWANSVHIEAGFGRYSKKDYHPQQDGEAKDLYRLYGRKVLPDRSCSKMNENWRVVLRYRKLAAVRIHRQPGAYPKPYFHIIWKYKHRHSWMREKYSAIPGTVNGSATPGSWLWNMGFDRMEHFDVRVGAEQYPDEFLFSN